MDFNTLLNGINNLKRFGSQFSQEMTNYPSQVQADKQALPEPFFNQDNTFPQWISRLAEDTKKRGPIQGLQDLTNPIIQHPSIYPYAEPIISNVRRADYLTGKKTPIISTLFQ